MPSAASIRTASIACGSQSKFTPSSAGADGLPPIRRACECRHSRTAHSRSGRQCVVKLATMFDDYLKRWELMPDGEPIITRSSRLLPVRSGDLPAMLKIALIDEERIGGLLMKWWGGHGAARVMAHDENAILIETRGREHFPCRFCSQPG